MEAQVLWLAILLIVFQIGDAVAAAIPIQYIKDDLTRLGCSEQLQRIIPMVKFASVVGLVIGLFVPVIGVLTCIALGAYFVVALEFHRRANDPIVKYVPAAGIAIWVFVVGLVSYLPAA